MQAGFFACVRLRLSAGRGIGKNTASLSARRVYVINTALPMILRPAPLLFCFFTTHMRGLLLTGSSFLAMVQYMVDKIDLTDLDEEDYDTVLAQDIEFSGTIKFKEPFMIRGIVSGKIIAESDIMIDEQAQVHADIHADQVVIKGSVKGDIVADTLVHVFSCGRLEGDVTAPDVILDSGCFFSGICTMTKST